MKYVEEIEYAAKVKREKCVSCGTCFEECPEETITLDKEEIAAVDGKKCTECGKCVEVCPSEAIELRLIQLCSNFFEIHPTFKDIPNAIQPLSKIG